MLVPLTTLTVHLEKYCVYAHSLDGEIFYIGKGLSQRPFDWHYRNEAWLAIATGAGMFDVMIVGWYQDEDEALACEKYLIKKLRPIANINGSGEGMRFKSLVDRGNKREPCVRNVARLTNYGHINDLDRFKVILRRHLGVPSTDQTWEMSPGWVRAYEEYFFKPDKEYLAKRDRPPIEVSVRHVMKGGRRMVRVKRKKSRPLPMLTKSAERA